MGARGRRPPGGLRDAPILLLHGGPREGIEEACGMTLHIDGVKTLISWDRLVLCELVED
jgi:hypothetical protein